MLKLASLTAFCIALLGFATFGAAAGPQDRSVMPSGSYLEARNWDERICCKRGWQDWFTTWRACNRQGGHVVRNGECRDDWNSTWDARWWRWGGNDWNKRICCKQGRRDWWSSARECREAGGWEAPKRQCRNG